MEPANKRAVPRQQVVRTLAKAISSHFLTVVTAPAGYGKTSLAKSLLYPASQNRFYYSVAAGLSGAGQWWDFLFGSLAEKGLEAAPELRRMGFPHNASMTRHAIRLLEDVCDPFVIIMDDCHNFVGDAVDVFLEALTRAEPAQHRLVMFSRAVPQIDLPDMERKGLAALFDQKLLQFSEVEARKLFFLNGISDKAAADRAWRYSEGWVTALWLCAQNLLAGGEMKPVKDIESLLEANVFATYPVDDQKALMQLSVLDHFTPSEAELVVGAPGIHARLLDMSHENVLITLDQPENKYTFHSIFRDFLQKKFAAENDVNTPDLYRRSAECHILRRDSMPAFRLLVEAGRDEDLLRILEVIASDGRQSIFKAKRGEFRPILEKIPWRLRLKQPLGYLLFVWLCFDDDLGDPAAVALFEEAAKRFATAKHMPRHLKRRLAGEMEFMRGWIHTNDEPRMLVSRYENALKLLDGPSILQYEQRCWNMGCPHTLFVYLPKGVRYRDLFEALTPAVQPMRILTGGVIEGCDSVATLEYHLERGEFETAARLVNDLDQILDFPRNMSSYIMARFSRARLLSVAGDEKNAAVILADILHRVEATGSSEHIQCAELAQSYVLATIGRLDDVPKWLRDGDIFENPYGAARVRGFMVTVCGKLLLANDDLDGFAAFMSNHRVISSSMESAFSEIHIAVLEAILAWSRKDENKALAAMREALDLTRPDGFILSLGEYGSHVHPILRRLEKEAADDNHLKAAIGIAERMEVIQRRRKNKAKRALTPRECEVMRLVVKGKPTAAISEKLGVTESIVKHTLGLAYKKLGAKNRAEAAHLFQRASPRSMAPKPSEHHESDFAVRNPAINGSLPRRDDLAETLRFYPCPGKSRDLYPKQSGFRFQSRSNLCLCFGKPTANHFGMDIAQALTLFCLPGSGIPMASHFEEIGAAVRLFPWQDRLKHPLEYLAFLWRRLRVFDRGISAVELDEAEYRLSRTRTGSRYSDDKLAGEIALLRSLLSAHDVEMLWNGHDMALKLLKGPSRLFSADRSWTFGNPHFSLFAVREAGGFEQLAPRVASASETLSALSNRNFISLDVAFRMERHLERGETNAAHALLPELESQGDADMQALILAAFSRARLSLADGQVARAIDPLERLISRVHRLDSFELSTSLDLALGYVYADIGRVDDIPLWIRAGNVFSLPYGATVRSPIAAVVYAKTLLKGHQ